MFESIETEYLRTIVLGSMTLQERLDGPFKPLGSPSPLAKTRLARWQQKISPNTANGFSKRLGWLGSTPQDIVCLLDQGVYEGALPPWTRYLEQALAVAHASQNTDPNHAIDDTAHAFGALVAPFAQVGRDLITPVCKTLFSAQAIDQLVDELMADLSHQAAPTFYLMFSQRRSQAPASPNPDSRHLYDTFIHDMLAGGMEAAFLEYPVLARLLTVLLEDWVTNTCEMAEALSRDRQELASVFADGHALGLVTNLELSLSDRHNGGKTVSILLFSGGARIVYKPRDISIERAWFNLLARSR